MVVDDHLLLRAERVPRRYAASGSSHRPHRLTGRSLGTPETACR